MKLKTFKKLRKNMPKKWLFRVSKKKWNNRFYMCMKCEKFFERKDSDVKKIEMLEEKYKYDRVGFMHLSCLYDITCEKCIEPEIISIKEGEEFVDKWRENTFGKNYQELLWFKDIYNYRRKVDKYLKKKGSKMKIKMFRKDPEVCQNCEFGNNKKGKWIKRKIRKNWEQGWWHIFCEKKQKYYAWDKYKRCFKENKGSE